MIYNCINCIFGSGTQRIGLSVPNYINNSINNTSFHYTTLTTRSTTHSHKMHIHTNTYSTNTLWKLRNFTLTQKNFVKTANSVDFTELLRKWGESKFPQFRHCVHHYSHKSDPISKVEQGSDFLARRKGCY